MELTFYIAGGVAVISTVIMLTRLNLVHALLYLIVSLLSVAVDFFVLGAPFAAALEAIVYAGAIMVLFLFVVMMLNIGRRRRGNGKTMADAGHLDRARDSGQHPYCRGRLPGAEAVSARLGTDAHGTEGSRDRLVRSVHDWRGIGLHAHARGPGGCLSSGLSAKLKNRRFNMTQIPMRDGLMLAGILFSLGLTGLLVRRNLIFVLMSLEVMLNAAGLAFVVAGSRWQQADGQVMFMFILAMAAAEVAVGLALVMQIYHRFKSLGRGRTQRDEGLTCSVGCG